jgi:uracil-DNA glycosylase family protein
MAARTSLPVLSRAVHECRNCDLWKNATQAVFGEGRASARIVFIGEQPGDMEDREGRPFVGPAGKLFDRALAEAGLDRKSVYVTNAVKHFKWEPRGKRRLHSKPNAAEQNACRPWLDGELAAIKPEVVVCLGATAAQAILGKSFRVTRDRGTWQPSPVAPRVMATFHPASILRMPDADARKAAIAQLVADIARAAKEAARVSHREAS